MPDFFVDRRGLMMAAAAAPAVLAATPVASQPPTGRDPSGDAPTPDQQRRMKWWHDAKFGMFIHFGLYAAHGRHEWAMEMGRSRLPNIRSSPPALIPPRALLENGPSSPRLLA